MNLSMSMPNLPGMTPDRTSWYHRQDEGFGRVVYMSRPSSGVSKRNRSASTRSQSPFVYGNQDAEEPESRPTTAGGSRGAIGIEFLRNMSKSAKYLERPRTAGSEYGRFYHAVDPSYPSTPQLLDAGQTTFMNEPFKPRNSEKEILVGRYYGYFYQKRPWEEGTPLGEPVIEKKIARRVTIHYYIKDDTIEINEPKQINSGMPSGRFYRRNKLYKENSDEFITMADLVPGKSFRALGQEIFVADADAFTRDYAKNQLGLDYPSGQQRPAPIRRDLGAQYATGMGSKLPEAKTKFGSRSTDYTVTKEAMMKTNNFLKYDGRVLKFLCVEVNSLYPPFFPHLNEKYGLSSDELIASGSVKRFALSYYLSSNTVELMLQKMKGSGRALGYDEPKLVVKKSKLPKNWREVQRGQTPQIYEITDLLCGNVVDVFGRYFLLVSCDPFTRGLYEEMGIQQMDVPLITEEKERVEHPIPERGDGFLAIGSEADTLGTVYGMPKPQKDFNKLMRNQGRQVRCRAQLITDSPIDSTREFMITYFLEDDTIQIYEDSKRNSGITGGNFLKRGKYTNTSPLDGVPRPFVPTDIFLGNEISLIGVKMRIIEMDNMTLRFCENYPDEFPMMDTFKIVNGLVSKVLNQRINLCAYFASVDRARAGYVNQAQFVEGLDALGLIEDLNDQEVLTILRRFKSQDKYDYEELNDLFSFSYNKMVMEGKAARPLRDPLSEIESGDLRDFLRLLRRRNNQWRRILHRDLSTHEGCITQAVLKKFFMKHGLKMSPSVMTEVYHRYRVEGPEAENILQILKKKRVNEDITDILEEKVYTSFSAKNTPKASNKHSLIHAITHTMAVTPSTKKRSLLLSSAKLDATNSVDLNSSYYSTDSGGGEFNYAKVLINFRQLMDDVYCLDWC